MLIEVFVFLVVLIIWWVLEDKRKYKGYPPGPIRFPLIGNLPQLCTKSPLPFIAFEELSKSYGNIMFLNIGELETVVFSSYKTIMEIFSHERAVTRGGFKIPVVKDRMLGRNLGVLWGNGDVWETLRRFTLRTLRDFGYGKTLSMDFVINEELDKFTDHFDKLIKTNSDGIVHFEAVFDLTVVNVLWRLVTGVNYSLDDPHINNLLKLSNDQVKSTSFAFDFSIAFPWTREWFPWLYGRKDQLRIVQELHQFARDTINEHRNSGNYSVDPKGFVDVFLDKIDGSKENKHSAFNDDQLLLTILDLFQAGAETTSKTLTFGVLYMVLNPEIQEKVQREIDNVVSPDEPIIMSFKPQLPYSYATLLEVLRYSTVVPFPPLRQASDDFYYEGHFIRKGTALMPNVYAAHFSKEIWGDPHTFRPERFLTSDGTVDSKIESFVIPFGGGKRLCVGKNLAEANLFLYFTSVLRNYKFSKIPNTPDPSIVPIPGVTNTPQSFDTHVVRRFTRRK